MEPDIDNKIIGYDEKGRPIIVKDDWLACCHVECRVCKKKLSCWGGGKKVYCVECAKRIGLKK